MAQTKRGVAAWLLVAAVVAIVGASLITDTSGANLELVPVFFGAALAVAGVRIFRSRSGRSRS